MPGRVVFFAQSGTFEPAYQLSSMAVTAAAMNEQVYIVFGFEALRHLMRGRFGLPHTERELAESARAEGVGALPPMKMLQEARELGAKLLACDTMVKLCGFTAQDVEKVVDEVTGLPSIWRLTDGARVVSV
jgi:peroxiredoxin family protein